MQKNCEDGAKSQTREVWGWKGGMEECEFITSSHLSNFLNWQENCKFSPLLHLFGILSSCFRSYRGAGEMEVGVNARPRVTLAHEVTQYFLIETG